MTEPVERALGRVEGQLGALTDAMKDAAKDFDAMSARFAALEVRQSKTEIDLTDIRMDLAKIAPVADEFVGLRKRAAWSAAFVVGLISLASFVGLDRLVAWLGSLR